MKRCNPGLRPLAVATALVLAAAAPQATAFDIPVHLKITRGEIRPLTAQVNGQTRRFSARALEDIGKANEDVDSILLLSAALFRPSRHFTNESYSASSQRVLDLRRQVLQLVRQSEPQGAQARIKLGQALHTIQDFYSHSNWVERNGGANTALGRSTLSNPSATADNCPVNPNTLGPAGGGALTSAYYVGALGCGPIPQGKCYHGNYMAWCLGINKDLDAAGAAHHEVTQSPFHGAAAAQARQNTRQFVQGILDELEGNDPALAALLDIKGTLGFVVDDTGSMGSSIDGVVRTIDRIIAATDIHPTVRPDNYLFLRFGDPRVGAPMVTKNAAAVRGAVAAIVPSGGGDCPELSQTGLISAVEASFVRSLLYLFSDATAKDSRLANQVIARAQAKRTRLNYALTGSCSPIDPAYVRGADETGGQLFRLAPSELPKLFSLIEPQLSGDLETIVRRDFELVAGDVRSVDVPVDAHTRKLVASATVVANDVAANHTVKLYRPSGAQVSAADAGVAIVTLSSGIILTVDDPEAGAWRAEIAGYGPISLMVQGNTDISFDRFDFVEASGDIHGGFSPIEGLPVRGATATAEASVLGPVGGAQFSLIDRQGNVVAPLPLDAGSPVGDPEHFIGETVLPATPFKVVVTGVDDTGTPYRREYPTLYRVQDTQVSVSGSRLVEMGPGESRDVAFKVRNDGPDAVFAIVVEDDQGYVTSTPQTSRAIASGEEATITVSLTVPATATEGDTTSVVLTATQSDAPDRYNSARLGVLITDANQAPICLEPASQVRIWPPNGKMMTVPLAGSAVAHDPEGGAITFTVESITQDEAVGPAPDGAGLGTPDAQVRAERDGQGNGRVYQVNYRATDDGGQSCTGFVQIGVPHDTSDEAAVDDGQQFDATGG